MNEQNYILEPIGIIRSGLTAIENAPLQGKKSAPDTWLELNASVAQRLVGITAGDELLVLTWLHRTQRDLLQVHSRDNLKMPLTGVFVTRSPDRPTLSDFIDYRSWILLHIG